MRREGALGALPAAALSPPDADQLARLLERGSVKVNLDIQVKSAESAASGNVIAEVEGTGSEGEIVLIGCHLDSWDLGTGAIDDAAGCGIVVAAANLIQQLPQKPRRTIRVVLYGSEEVGLFGGRAYATAHVDELDKHVLAAESDFGAGRIWRLTAVSEMARWNMPPRCKAWLRRSGSSRGITAPGAAPTSWPCMRQAYRF